ncbi:hypothetical protein OG410_14665 [Streptomyces sp. NBC_00659]|uniref:hypothetical protein n=1 Tax=Streptomyces sp. NBC_00659 TaxID=2903669 RepID=UPI002E307E22|nr:hypothetical protein [Streptomyces sp. NBC_00659]
MVEGQGAAPQQELSGQPQGYGADADAFVMFSPDKNAVGFTVLPERAARTPEDVDRLRAILDRNLTRA